jgi:phosphate transport system protein
MRDRYLKQMQAVNDDLLRMGSRVEHALNDAVRALGQWNTDLAQQVITNDREIDAIRTSVEEAVFFITATQQPVATDLRSLFAAVAIAAELERSGDYAKGIAKRVGRCLRSPALIEVPPGLLRLGAMSQAMLNTCLNAFVHMDLAAARSLALDDQRVDELEDQVMAELLTIARQDPTKIECAIHLMDVAHTLERVADRATNVAERIVFISTSTTEVLNS